MKANRNGMMPLSDQQIRDRAWALEAAGHPTGGGRPRAGAPKTVIQCLMEETGLSREVLHRVLRKDRTRGGKKRQDLLPSKNVGPSKNQLMGHAVAKAVIPTHHGAKAEAVPSAQTMAMLQQALLDAERRNETLRQELEAVASGSEVRPMTSPLPIAPTSLDPRSELVTFLEVVPVILAWKGLPPRLRLVLQHYDLEVRRLL